MIALASIFFALFMRSVVALDSYTMWCVGNCDKDVKTETTTGIVLMGGGVTIRNEMNDKNKS